MIENTAAQGEPAILESGGTTPELPTWIYTAPTDITNQALAEYLTEHPNITHLNLYGCRSLTHLPEQLPPSLRNLQLNGCYGLTHLPEHLPSGLQGLDILSCHSLTHLPQQLPRRLECLYLYQCSKLTCLPHTLPSNLKRLIVNGCRELTALPPLLPPGLQGLYLRECHGLTHLPERLPANLVTLDLTDCSSLKQLPEPLPSSLQTLELYGCRSLTDLPAQLPPEQPVLNLYACHSLTHLPERLPPRLKHLNLYACHSLIELPEQLPLSIEELDLRECHSLTHLPEHLPPNLPVLNLNACHSLTHLSEKLPPSLQKLYLSECRNLTHLPEQLPPGLELLTVLGCHRLTRLPVLKSDRLRAHFYGNWRLLTLDEETKADCRLAGTEHDRPQFVPGELIKDSDLSYPSAALAIRLAWKQAIYDTFAELAQDIKPAREDSNRAQRAWLHRLLELEQNPRAWKQAPCGSSQQKLRQRFEQARLKLLSLPKQELLRIGGVAGIAIATLHGQTLSPAEQAALTKEVEHTGAPAADKVNLVIGLKAAAFRQAFLELAEPLTYNTSYTSAQAALRLTLTFGKSWKNWLTSRASTIRESATDPVFVHDASFWLPLEPVNKLAGLSDWLFQPQHKGKPINQLYVIAKHWSSLEPQDRKLPYLELLERVCAKVYPGAQNAQLALEASSWGIAPSDYAEIERRFMASLAVPSPFPLQKRWSQEGLTGRFLPRDDVRGLFLGQHTDCCQHPDGAGDTAAWYGQEQGNAGFFVVEDRYGSVVAQSMVWIARKGTGLVFDSAECRRLGARETAVVAIYSKAAEALSSTFPVVTLGTGTNKLKAQERWTEAGDRTLQLPEGDDPYTDSGSQVLLARTVKERR